MRYKSDPFIYKSKPFILATQSTKIFSLQYNALGKDLRVVQKFEYRGMYNVPEMDDDCHTPTRLLFGYYSP